MVEGDQKMPIERVKESSVTLESSPLDSLKMCSPRSPWRVKLITGLEGRCLSSSQDLSRNKK